MSRYQKGDANLDFTEARDSEWQWHQLGHMQVCTSLQTDNHASTTPLFLTGRMPFLPPNQKRQITEGQHIETAAEYVCWHCPRSMRSRVYASVGRPSVCLSVRLYHPAAARPCWLRVCCCGPGGHEIDRLLHDRRPAAAAPQHGAQQQMRAVPRCQLT